MVKADGRHQQVRCPAHDDRQASLSIDAGKQGGVVVKCHAGCATRAVLDAGGLVMADLQPAGDAPRAAGNIVATYPYRDEQGHELYQVLRLSPKSFRQRRADGVGGWLWQLDGVRRVLYRLPDIMGADTVWMVEGEKDADRLAAEGLPVTTWAGGATAWRADYIAQLKGAGARTLIVLPDNDDPGRRCARTIVAAATAAGIDARAVELAGLPPKGDVSDWLDAGHDASELERLTLNDELPTYGVSLDDFRAYMPDHLYIFAPTRAMWPAASVNARLPPMPVTDADGRAVLNENGGAKTIKASLWLDKHQPVEQMTWSPGDPLLIRDRLVAEGGWVDRPGCACFNQYRGPTLKPGDASKADPWIDHVRFVYPDDAEHLFNWFAHRVQRPHEKINHALVFGGNPGIGKDTILEPLAHAIGPWNMGDISAPALLGVFNGFLKSVVLRVSEARDLGEIDRYAFYERSKLYIAAPPDVLRVNEKHLREYPIRNVCGLLITTNHKSNGLYLPADDRRHYVAWSELSAELQDEDVPPDYFQSLYDWFAQDGYRHVLAWLQARPLRGFNPKAPPPKTAAFWAIVDAGRSPEDAEMADAVSSLGQPDALTVDMLSEPPTPDDFRTWLKDRRSRPRIPHRLESCGYVASRSPYAKDGLWIVHRRRCVVYVKASLSVTAQHEAAHALADH